MLDPEVSIEEAFPALVDPGKEATVERILAKRRQPWKQGSYQGPRNHVLEEVRCGHQEEDGGSPCGLKKSATYDESGTHFYSSTHCSLHGHCANLPGVIDDAVLDLLRSLFTPDLLRSAIKQIRVNSKGVLQRAAEIRKKIDKLEREIDVSWEMEKAARKEDDYSEVERARSERQRYREQKEAAEERLTEVEVEEDEIRAARGRDLAEILSLGSNLDSLLSEARALENESAQANGDGEYEGEVRAIVSELVDCVFARRLAPRAYEVVVRFPTGREITRVVFSTHIRCSQPERSWAYHRLREDGVSPQDVADELNGWAPESVLSSCPWEPPRVRTAALIHEYDEPTPVRSGEHNTVSELASKFGLTEQEVWEVGMRNRLGPARFQDGELAYAPTREEAERISREWALERAAREHGWPTEDTVAEAELKRSSEVDHHWIQKRARYGSGVISDSIGRNYVRLSDMQVTEKDFIRDALEHADPALQELDPEHWTALAEAVEQVNATRPTVKKHAPVLRLSDDAPTKRSVYVWIGAEVVAELE